MGVGMHMVESFSWIAGLSGGILIGLGSAVFLLFNGRIAGISGVVGGLLGKWDATALWRIPFIVGLPLGAWLFMQFAGHPVTVDLRTGPVMTVVAGLLVGFGTRLGSGCTSGHGVCGLARLSARSLVATGVFMVTAIVTVFITRHVVGG